jgi:signal-transduction protein with cAMP-binding, CBS, and nucleotidyltransferase domain
MTQGRFRHMPVIDDGKLAGLVSIGDAVKARLDMLELETESMKEYIGGR